MNNIQLNLKNAFLLLLFTASVGACKMEEVATIEAPKEVRGIWRINRAVRNGADITEKFNFGDFRIEFKDDGSYELSNPIPFIVSSNGTFALDDPQYPFQITFSETTGSDEVRSNFDYPIVEGKRQLSLTFNTGCSSNSYVYTLISDQN